MYNNVSKYSHIVPIVTCIKSVNWRIFVLSCRDHFILNRFVIVDVLVKILIITASGYFCTIWGCVFYFTRVRKSFWIASLAKPPLCFPFQLFCSCASAFRFLTGFIKEQSSLRRFRGLMAYAEVAVRGKHDRMQHRAAITQPLTGYWWLQWKWSFRTFFFNFFYSSSESNFMKWPPEGTSVLSGVTACVKAEATVLYLRWHAHWTGRE